VVGAWRRCRVGIGARLGNVLFWIVVGAIAGLAIGSPEDGS
jgi:hypothetical protein